MLFMEVTKSLKRWNCILILVILYCSESLMFREMYSASIRAGIIIAFSLLYIVLAGKGKHIACFFVAVILYNFELPY